VFALAGTSLASRRREFLSALDDALARGVVLPDRRDVGDQPL